MATDVRHLVDVEHGLMSRRIFIEREIYEQELVQIFARCWLFLYREARLLDERRFREWLALLTDDVRYWMAGRSNPYPQVSKALVILDPDR